MALILGSFPRGTTNPWPKPDEFFYQELRVRSPKNGTFLERQIFVWHATIVIGSIIAIGLEK